MRHGLTLPGQQRPDDDHWHNDILAKCYWDDRLWGYACRVSEEIRTRSAEDFTNPVLFQLLFMGTFDWDNENCCNDQSTQAMRHSTVMGSCLYDAIRLLTTEVRVVWNGGELRLIGSPSIVTLWIAPTVRWLPSVMFGPVSLTT